MNIILDLNILLSALIKDSITRKTIVSSNLRFYFPEPSLDKINKYKNYIIQKSGLSETEYLRGLTILFDHIQLVSKGEIIDKWNKAKEIMEKIDSEEVVFIALALKIKDSIIWSDDTHFTKQNIIRVIKTKEIIKLFEKGD